MLQWLKDFWYYLLGESEAEVRHPLSRENAYVLSSIGKKGGHYSDVTREYQKDALKQIKQSARFGSKYILINHPRYATPSDKESIVNFISELGYSICFINDDIMVISWKYSPNDFKMK